MNGIPSPCPPPPSPPPPAPQPTTNAAQGGVPTPHSTRRVVAPTLTATAKPCAGWRRRGWSEAGGSSRPCKTEYGSCILRQVMGGVSWAGAGKPPAAGIHIHTYTPPSPAGSRPRLRKRLVAPGTNTSMPAPTNPPPHTHPQPPLPPTPLTPHLHDLRRLRANHVHAHDLLTGGVHHNLFACMFVRGYVWIVLGCRLWIGEEEVGSTWKVIGAEHRKRKDGTV